MGLFGFVKSQLINVIEWTDDNSENTMVYRFPVDGKEIKNGAQLTVRESQVAIFVNEGTIADVFTPGRYQLTTNNIPVLTKLNSWKYDFNSPFKAEVYFVNTKMFQGKKWGTSNPIPLRDADFGIVRIRAYGTYAVQVKDAATFLKQVFGTAEKYTVESVTTTVKSMIVSAFTDFLAETKMPVLDIPTKYNEISDGTNFNVNEKLDLMGLKVEQVVVENISLPDSVEKAIDERSALGTLNSLNQNTLNAYTQLKAADAIGDAAKNGNGMAGAAMGIGAGLGFGRVMSNTMANATENSQPAAVKVVCPHCGATVAQGKFCPECGKPLVEEKVKCIKCGAEIKKGSKFCPECGASQVVEEVVCPKCGAKLKAGAKFCPECGEKL